MKDTHVGGYRRDRGEKKKTQKIRIMVAEQSPAL